MSKSSKRQTASSWSFEGDVGLWTGSRCSTFNVCVEDVTRLRIACAVGCRLASLHRGVSPVLGTMSSRCRYGCRLAPRHRVASPPFLSRRVSNPIVGENACPPRSTGRRPDAHLSVHRRWVHQRGPLAPQHRGVVPAFYRSLRCIAERAVPNITIGRP